MTTGFLDMQVHQPVKTINKHKILFRRNLSCKSKKFNQNQYTLECKRATECILLLKFKFDSYFQNIQFFDLK